MVQMSLTLSSYLNTIEAPKTSGAPIIISILSKPIMNEGAKIMISILLKLI